MLSRIGRCFKNKRAQSTAEYAIVLGLVIAAVVAMQVYVKRSIQAKVKDASDVVTAQTGGVGTSVLTNTKQYEPYYLSREQQQTVTQDQNEKTVLSGGAATTTADKVSTTSSVVQYRSTTGAD